MIDFVLQMTQHRCCSYIILNTYKGEEVEDQQQPFYAFVS